MLLAYIELKQHASAEEEMNLLDLRRTPKKKWILFWMWPQISWRGCYALTLLKVQEFVVGLASRIKSILDATDEMDRNELLQYVGLVFVKACDCIKRIVV